VADEIKFGKAVMRDMKYLRHKPAVKQLVEQGSGDLTDLSGNHLVKIEWKLNDVAKRDKVFKLQIDEKVVYLDLEELTYYTRVMFI
jgi:hypothetical protein